MSNANAMGPAPLPPMIHWIHNGVVLIQAVFVLASPFISLAAGESVIIDRAMDGLFAAYLCLIALRCIFDRPSFLLLSGLLLVGAYGAAGLVESIMIDNLPGFIFEAKLLLSMALFFCLLDKRPTVTELTVKILFYTFLVASVVYMVGFKGARLHIINESNYVCMYIGITMFSYLSWKKQTVSFRTIILLGVFTLYLIVVTQSRTGALFLGFTWMVYLWERFGMKIAFLASIGLMIVAIAGAIAAVALKLPIVSRFEELKNPNKVDRFIYFQEAVEIVKMRPVYENIIRLSFSKPVSTRVDGKMKWLTSKSEHGTEVGQLYPHHFHLAYLRILMGHGIIALIIYLIAIPLLWRVNKYLSIGVAVCSLSMSVPYLSLFFGTLQLAMAFPSSRKVNESI